MRNVSSSSPLSRPSVVVKSRWKGVGIPRVILADDEVDTRGMIAESLRDAGYDVEEAVDGERAYAAILREHPSLLITDCTMPNMSGSELVELLAHDPRLRAIPTIVISALARPRLPANVTKFLAKPFRMEQLHAAVRECLPAEP